MREFKLRAWDTISKAMKYAPMIFFKRAGGGYTVSGDGHRWIIMQYTGLVDKNGKEIYEGDIVSVVNSQNVGVTIDQVIWKVEQACWYLNNTTHHDMPLAFWSLSNYHNIEVLGNIYENPNLLPDANNKV